MIVKLTKVHAFYNVFQNIVKQADSRATKNLKLSKSSKFTRIYIYETPALENWAYGLRSQNFGFLEISTYVVQRYHGLDVIL